MESIGISETPEALDPEIIALKNNLHSNYGSDPFPYYHNLEDMGPKTGKSDVDKVELDLEILWDEHTVRTEEGDEAHEFRAVEKALPVVGTELIDTFTYTLMALVKDGETVYYLMQFSHMEGSNLQATFNEPAGFNGTVQVYDMARDLASILYLEDGEIVSQVTADEFGNTKTARSNCDAMRGGSPEMNSIYDFENPTCNFGGGGRYIDIIVEHFTDYYNVRGNGVYEYSHTVHEGTTLQSVWIPDQDPVPDFYPKYFPREYPGESGPNHDPADFYNWYNQNREELLAEKESFLESMDEFEERILDSQLRPCLKTIVNDLKNIQAGVGHIVVKFAGNNPGFNWEVKDGTLAGGTAQTSSSYNRTTGTVTTTFDSQSWQQATELSWARTILHESVHAFLVAEFAIDRPNWIATYPQMVAEWDRLQNWNAVHHEEFARSIVMDIAHALEEYGRSQGYNLSSQFYQDMSWAGLQSTTTFQAMSTATKNRILDVIAVELTGQDINANPKTQKGANAGC